MSKIARATLRQSMCPDIHLDVRPPFRMNPSPGQRDEEIFREILAVWQRVTGLAWSRMALASERVEATRDDGSLVFCYQVPSPLDNRGATTIWWEEVDE